MTTFDDCILEINLQLGTLYVHSKQTGHTILRLQLPTQPQMPQIAAAVEMLPFLDIRVIAARVHYTAGVTSLGCLEPKATL